MEFAAGGMGAGGRRDRSLPGRREGGGADLGRQPAQQPEAWDGMPHEAGGKPGHARGLFTCAQIKRRRTGRLGAIEDADGGGAALHQESMAGRQFQGERRRGRDIGHRWLSEVFRACLIVH
jgi:hypothetical protein